jgi:hypothetical protein
MAETDPGAPAAPPSRTAAPTPPDRELARLRSEASFHQRFRELTLEFSRGIPATLGLGAALRQLTLDANVLLGASRTSVWLHDRTAREVVLVASSDEAYGRTAARVPTTDTSHPVVRGLRLARPLVSATDEAFLLLAPLRGWRRALGALAVEGPFSEELEGAQLADLAHELARQLSATVENIQLLQEILRQRRLLDARGHVQRARRSGGRHRRRRARRPDERRVRDPGGPAARRSARPAAAGAGRA